MLKTSKTLHYIKHKYILNALLLSSFLFLGGCNSLKRTALGFDSKIEYVVDNKERIKHYQPFLNADNVSIYTFKNPTEFCKYLNFFSSQLSTLYFEDIENNKYYKISCFDDLKSVIEDLNNEDITYLNTVSAEEFLSIKNYIVNTSEMVIEQIKQEQPKKWNIYLATGTFVGGIIKKRTLAVTKSTELNHLYILDLSVDDPNKEFTDKDFKIEGCMP